MKTLTLCALFLLGISLHGAGFDLKQAVDSSDLIVMGIAKRLQVEDAAKPNYELKELTIIKGRAEGEIFLSAPRDMSDVKNLMPTIDPSLYLFLLKRYDMPSEAREAGSAHVYQLVNRSGGLLPLKSYCRLIVLQSRTKDKYKVNLYDEAEQAALLGAIAYYCKASEAAKAGKALTEAELPPLAGRALELYNAVFAAPPSAPAQSPAPASAK